MAKKTLSDQNNESNAPKQQKKVFKIGLTFKVTALITILILFVSAISIYTIYSLSYNALKGEFTNKLTVLASACASIIDTEKLKTIQKEEDENSENYLELQKVLKKYMDASLGKINFLYTMKMEGDKCIYIIDATPIEDAENHSTVGSEFPLDKFPEAMNGFIEPTAEKEILKDEEFKTWSQSGYAPIKDEKGEVIGVVGLDMDVTTLMEDEKKMIMAGQISLGISLILSICLGILFSQYLTKPIFLMTKMTKSVAEGNFDVSVPITRNDEFGQLAHSFNAMTYDLKISHETLKKYNLELEQKVEERTVQLSKINREIKDILDNMSQAIFTIDDDFNFNDQHSKFAYDIFGSVSFSSKNILDIFFSGKDQLNQRNNISEWLRRVFRTNRKSWENLEALQPVREIAIHKLEQNGDNSIRYIQVDFQPIIDSMGTNNEEKVIKVMVIVQDITDRKKLQLEMQQKEKDYKDNISQIIEVINLDQEIFDEFIKECQDNLLAFEPMLLQLRDDKENMDLINNLFRVMHTLKGNAMIFKLERVAGQANSIETIFASLRKQEAVLTNELLDDVFKKMDYFNIIFNEILDIYNKITSGKTLNSSTPQIDEQVVQENETIKVKLQEINRLSELTKKAELLVNEDNTLLNNKITSNQDTKEIEMLLRQTQEHISTLSRISISKLFARFPRMIYDLSNTLNKKVKVKIKGDDLYIDKNISDKLSDPLVHILRNCVDHGLEMPNERKDLGKPLEGTIEIIAELFENNLTVTIKDDGRGLDVEKLKAKAVRKGLLPPEIAMIMSDKEAMDIIFLPGFSTNDTVSDISGRGVGMDVVKTSIEEGLRGTIILESKKNMGLSISLKIPTGYSSENESSIGLTQSLLDKVLRA